MWVNLGIPLKNAKQNLRKLHLQGRLWMGTEFSRSYVLVEKSLVIFVAEKT